MWLIVGLGNPGARYELTRHNIGFLAVDALMDRAQASTARFTWAGFACMVLKPQTFMNRSGQAVQQAVSFYKIPMDHVIVVHDELDLPLGELRIKQGGGDGGHNGLKDITRLLGPDYIRVRLGIGRPAHKGFEADFVLAPFSDAELSELELVLPKAIDALGAIMAHGLVRAQAENQIKLQKKA